MGNFVVKECFGTGVAAGILGRRFLTQPLGNLGHHILPVILGLEHPGEVVDAGNAHVEFLVDLFIVARIALDYSGKQGVALF
ncbi:MAG: hypothetical protein R2932_46190 [Caldilineaceae bacterium]